MIEYRDFRAIAPGQEVCEKVDQLIIETGGSVFHNSYLNKLFAKSFRTKFFYLVDDPNCIQLAAPVHLRSIRTGARQYSIGQLFDIPYTGFVGKGRIDFNAFRIGFFESLAYVGFPDPHNQSYDGDSSGVGETAMIDLAISEDHIFNSIIRSNRRNMIRKAIKNGVSVKICFDEEGWSLFVPLLEELHKKLGIRDLKMDFHRQLFSHYSSNKQAFIGIAFKNSKPLAGIMVIGNQNYMHYYKGASKQGVHNDGQGELLQWEAIRTSKILGSSMYDLCNLNKKSLPEIYRFKTGFSHEIFRYPIYNYNAIGYRILNRISKLICTHK